MAESVDIQKIAANIETRLGDVFREYDDAGTPAYEGFGILADTSVEIEPVLSDPDIAQRQKMLAADIAVTFIMKQTSETEMAAIGTLATPEGNGEKIVLTAEPTDSADVDTADDTITFVNVFPAFSAAFNYKGEDSMFTVTFGGRVPVAQLAAFDADQTLTFSI